MGFHTLRRLPQWVALVLAILALGGTATAIALTGHGNGNGPPDGRTAPTTTEATNGAADSTGDVADATDDTNSSSDSRADDFVVICHNAGTRSITITVDAHAWPAHEAHGDTLGACTDQTNTDAGPTTQHTPPTHPTNDTHGPSAEATTHGKGH